MILTVETPPFRTLLQWLSAMTQNIAGAMTVKTEAFSPEREFRLLITDNKPLIDKICFYYAANDQEYDDLHQDIYINIWRGIENFREECRKSTWIYRICLNTCVSTWRKNGRHNGLLSIDKILEPCDEWNVRKEDLEQLHYLISLLSPAEKSLLMMWLDERSYDEISEVTGFNRNTVATKLRRIKEKLTDIAHSKNWKL